MPDRAIDELAALARLKLDADEAARLGADMDKMLEFVQELQAIDVSGVEPLASINGLSTVGREDVPREGLDRETVLGASPSHNAGFVKVPKVLE